MPNDNNFRRKMSSYQNRDVNCGLRFTCTNLITEIFMERSSFFFSDIFGSVPVLEGKKPSIVKKEMVF
jgi:hypothetical protein